MENTPDVILRVIIEVTKGTKSQKVYLSAGLMKKQQKQRFIYQILGLGLVKQDRVVVDLRIGGI